MINSPSKKHLSFMTLIIAFVLLFGCVQHALTPSSSIVLTHSERDWLKAHSKIKVAPSPYWPPIDIQTNDGKYEGLSKEYLDLIGQALGITFEPVFFKSNVDLYESLKRKEIDLAVSSAYTSERSEYARFTQNYLRVPVLILARSDFADDLQEKDLVKYKVAIGNGFAAHEVLKSRYPTLRFVTADNDIKVIEKVATGEADVAVIDVADASHIISTYSYSNLKIVGQVNYSYSVSFAIRDDFPYLLSSINKVLSSISDSQKNQFYEKWIHIEVKPFYMQERFILSVLTLLALIGMVAIWNVTLRHKVKERTSEILELNAHLERRVDERTKQLSELNAELDANIEELMATQSQLVEAERYALLGRLVSGLAHKLNTPVGNIYTALSYQSFTANTFKEQFLQWETSSKALQEYLQGNEEACKLCLTNIEKIKKIVSDFKRLEFPEAALDAVESFALKELIYTVISEIQYTKNKPLTFQVDCAEDLVIRSYYIDLKQILMNLLSNAFTHGFGDEETGIIKVSAYRNGQKITLKLWNNGAPIPDEVLGHMYKPFYTTDMANYSGLGLSVVLNLIKNRLYGTIECSSTDTAGTEFVIEFMEEG